MPWNTANMSLIHRHGIHEIYRHILYMIHRTRVIVIHGTWYIHRGRVDWWSGKHKKEQQSKCFTYAGACIEKDKHEE
jgi:hypothetical protein